MNVSARTRLSGTLVDALLRHLPGGSALGAARHASGQHPLQGMTDQYLNEPARQQLPADDLSWSPSDLPPNSGRLSHAEPLAAWVCSEGGYVSQHLSLGTSPTLGCRGVLISEGLPQLAESEAVIMLPQHTTIGSAAAAAGLSAALSDRSITALSADPSLLVALFLATERRRGAASFWATYIQSLPERPPGAWALPKEAQAASLRRAGSSVSKGALRQAAKQRQEKLGRALNAYGGPLKLSSGDVAWAYGMVESRCYTAPVALEGGGTRQEPVMLPFVDMCNHTPGGLQPGWGNSHNGDRVACLVHTGSIPVGGRELFTDYFVRPLSAIDRLAKYGFV